MNITRSVHVATLYMLGRSYMGSHWGLSKPYLEGQGDLVTRLIIGIIGVTIWVIGVINLLTKSP